MIVVYMKIEGQRAGQVLGVRAARVAKMRMLLVAILMVLVLFIFHGYTRMRRLRRRC